MNVDEHRIPRVSVVMASYNHAPFVREAIESVLCQSFGDLELVITDDGSRDASAEIIRCITDPRVSLVAFPENRGASVAMNNAVGRARGDYISVLNSDDCFLPGKIERQVAFLDENESVGAVFGVPRFVDERGSLPKNRFHMFSELFEAENRTRFEWLRHFFSVGNCLCHPTVMVRRSCYEVLGGYDPQLMQLPDFDFWVRFCKRFEIHVLPDELTAFRIMRRERNVSAPALGNRARVAWESTHVLKHYASLSDADLRKVFSDLPRISESTKPKIELALEAVRLARPGYLQFGLALLDECIRGDPSAFRVQDYFRLVGETDPYAVRFSGALGRLLARSRIFALLDRLSKRFSAMQHRRAVRIRNRGNDCH